jgi:hypothetical protein
MRRAISCIPLTLAALLAVPALAKLPAPSDEAKAKAAEAAAKNAWSDKVAAYQLCRAMDRAAEHYRKSAKAASAPPADATPACADPGPFVAAAPPGASGAAPAIAAAPPAAAPKK